MTDLELDKLFKDLADKLKKETPKSKVKEFDDLCYKTANDNLIAKIQLYHDLMTQDYRTIKESDQDFFDQKLSTQQVSLITMTSMIEMHEKVFESFIQTYGEDL